MRRQRCHSLLSKLQETSKYPPVPPNPTGRVKLYPVPPVVEAAVSPSLGTDLSTPSPTDRFGAAPVIEAAVSPSFGTDLRQQQR